MTQNSLILNAFCALCGSVWHLWAPVGTLRKYLAPVGIVQVGTQNRSSDYNRQVREIVRSGGLGPIGLVKACNKGMIRFGRATRAPRRRGSIGTVGGFALRGTR